MKPPEETAIFAFVTLRPIFAILIAFAMLFAPFAMQSGSAMAAPADHHGQSMAEGHCGDRPVDGNPDNMSGQPCGMAMCVAIAVVPPAPFERPAFEKLPHRPALVRDGPSFLAKLPTPPPRLA